MLYIGDYLIKANTSISGSYTINDGTLLIAPCAFESCSSLTGITIPDSVTGICYKAFYDCTKLASITIPDSVTSIGYEAFYNCSKLTSITIPDSVTSIGYDALCGCSKLQSITLPFVGDSVKTSSDTYQYPLGYIFGSTKYTGGTETKQFYYGSSLSTNTSRTFYIPSTLTSVTITGGEILYCAFYGCSTLKSITLPNDITSIGDTAFYHCTSLTSITIPSSVTSIGRSAFLGCSSLASITIPEGVTAINGGTFGSCSNLTSVTIPNSVTSIGSSAFESCSSLISITIPKTVTSIGTFAFNSCYALKNVYYSGTEEEWNAITIDSYNSYLTSATITYNYGNTENNDTEETFTTYIDKTFEVYSGDVTFYKNDSIEWDGMANSLGGGYTLSFTFNSDGTGTVYSSNSYSVVVISFNYTVVECTSLEINYSTSNAMGNFSFSGTKEFGGYKFVFSNSKYTQYTSVDYLSSVTDEDAATSMTQFAIGYNDSGVYIYGLEGYAGSPSVVYYTMYGKLAEVTE